MHLLGRLLASVTRGWPQRLCASSLGWVFPSLESSIRQPRGTGVWWVTVSPLKALPGESDSGESRRRNAGLKPYGAEPQLQQFPGNTFPLHL